MLRTIKRLADNGNPDSLASRMRRRRLGLFFGLLEAFPEPVSILDVGGTVEFWNDLAPELPRECRITLLNIATQDCASAPHITSTAGDARRMDAIADGEFDLCFSNSVIEHVGTFADQRAMATEVQRVSKAIFIQTPNRYFPIEPHFLVPLWQFYPVSVRVALLRRFNLGWMPRTPDAQAARAEVRQIRLLNAAEMQALFPDTAIYREKLGPLTKSIVAWGRIH